MQPFLVLLSSILVGSYFLYLGVQGRREKIDRKLHGPAQELPGVFEGTVQRNWWIFLLCGLFALIVGVIEFINGI